MRLTLVGVVGSIHREVDEEWGFLVLFNEVTGFMYHQIGKKLPVLKDFFAIAVQVMAVWSLPVEEMRVVVNAPAHMPEGVVKSLRVGHVGGNVAEMPFADVCGFVALILEVFGNSHLLACHSGPALDGRGVAGNPGTQRIATG